MTIRFSGNAAVHTAYVADRRVQHFNDGESTTKSVEVGGESEERSSNILEAPRRTMAYVMNSY